MFTSSKGTVEVLYELSWAQIGRDEGYLAEPTREHRRTLVFTMSTKDDLAGERHWVKIGVCCLG
jgi:hypothetical protein